MALRIVLLMLVQLVGIALTVTAATLAFGLPGCLAALGIVLYVAADEFSPSEPLRVIVLPPPSSDGHEPRIWAGG
jgi:hypothetical protein